MISGIMIVSTEANSPFPSTILYFTLHSDSDVVSCYRFLSFVASLFHAKMNEDIN